MVCGVLPTGRKGRLPPVVEITLWASVGFIVAYLLQGKGAQAIGVFTSLHL